MKNILSYKLFENPDAIPWHQASWMDEDAIPFWILNNKSFIGQNGMTHNSMIKTFGKISYTYSGRIWVDKKLISFWNYPNSEELYPILKSLELSFEKDGRNIKIIDNDYKIEIISKYMKHGECIPIKDYIGSKSFDYINHIKTPLYK